MLDVLPPIGLLGLLAIWLLYTGRLKTKDVYQEMVEERNYWRHLSQTLAEQNKELMISAVVTRDVLESLSLEGDGEK